MVAEAVIVEVAVVTEARYLDPWSGKYLRAEASGKTYIHNPVLGSGPGFWGGHIDVDTSSELYPLGGGTTDGHVHEYDKKYETTVVDAFNILGFKSLAVVRNNGGYIYRDGSFSQFPTYGNINSAQGVRSYLFTFRFSY